MKPLIEVKKPVTFTTICMECKKVLSQHITTAHKTDVISHGICEKCARKLYPNFVD